MHDGLVVKAVAAICALALAGCSLWLNTDERQCSADAECVEAGLGSRCVQQVCMDTSSCSGDKCDASTSSDELGVGTSCASDDDCSARTPRCLNKTCVDTQTGDLWLCPRSDQTMPTPTVRYSFRVVEFISRMPPKDVVVKACYNNDVGCAEPVATYTDEEMTGHVQFALPIRFSGFFEIRSSNAVDTLLYVTKPIVKNTLNRDVPVLSTDGIDLLASLLGYPYDTSKGLALLEALDCSETPQGGIHFVSREGGDSFYLKDQVPNKEAEVTVYDSINNTASGGFINVPPGFVEFTARIGTDGIELGSFNAQIRARTITFIDMHF